MARASWTQPACPSSFGTVQNSAFEVPIEKSTFAPGIANLFWVSPTAGGLGHGPDHDLGHDLDDLDHGLDRGLDRGLGHSRLSWETALWFESP